MSVHDHDHGHDEHGHDEHGHGHAPATGLGYEPDHQPMGKLSGLVVIIALIVIGTGFGIGELLNILTVRQRAEFAANATDARLAASREAYKKLAETGGYDEELKLHRVPVAAAVQYVLKNPDKMRVDVLNPDLPKQNDPNAPEAGAATPSAPQPGSGGEGSPGSQGGAQK